MLKYKHPLDGAELITRSVVEQVAKIIGSSSAATQALKDADSHFGPVRFYLKRGSFIVEKLSEGECLGCGKPWFQSEAVQNGHGCTSVVHDSKTNCPNCGWCSLCDEKRN